MRALAPGGSATFVVTVTANPLVADGSTITDSAHVSADTPDPNAANNDASAATTVFQDLADLSIAKSVVNPNPPPGAVTRTGPDAMRRPRSLMAEARRSSVSPPTGRPARVTPRSTRPR